MIKNLRGYKNEAELKCAVLKEIREYHKKHSNVSPDILFIKMVLKHNNEKCVSIFESEFKKAIETGYYFELIDSEYFPIDKERKLYRVPNNKEYKKEYVTTSWDSYYVPLEECRIVLKKSIEKVDDVKKSDIFAFFDNFETKEKEKEKKEDDDVLFTEMTILDYYAIMSGNPLSKRKWLNDLIIKYK
jgi:hypothetical protein